jgi:bifunctional DNA-binding transcriptional regulator/antitoxin component of YhaV-PrlF toxin-antitoxin module
MSQVKKPRVGYTRLSTKHQVTIPAGVVAKSGVTVGTEFAVGAEADGQIVLRPADDRAACRRAAIAKTAASITGVWRPGDLEHLRNEWR